MSQDQYFSLLRAFDAQYGARPGAGLAHRQEILLRWRPIRVWYQPDLEFADEGVLLCNMDVVRLGRPIGANLCRLLLRADSLWAGTRGTTIGLRGDDMVTLSAARRVASLTPDLLAALLRDVERDARIWRARIAGRKRSSDNGPVAPDMLALRG